MKNISKRLAITILTVVMCCGLMVGCGNGSGSGTGTANNSNPIKDMVIDGRPVESYSIDENKNPKEYITYERDEEGNKVKAFYYNLNKEYLYECTYDKNGNRIKYPVMSGSSDPKSYVSYYCIAEYDEKGNVLKCYKEEKDGSLTLKDWYEYDEQGRVIKEKQNHYMYVMGYEYDDAGNKVKISEYTDDGELLRESFYNEKEQILYSWTYDSALGMKKLTKYNENEKIEKVEEIYADGNSFSTVYEYNKKGREIKNMTYFNGELESYICKEYGDNDRVTKETCYNKKNEREWEKEYDSLERTIKSSKYGNDNELIETTAYEYDANGNRVKELWQKYYDGEPTDRTEREYKDGIEIKETSYYKYTGKTIVTEYKDGKRIKCTTYDADMNVIKVEEF